MAVPIEGYTVVAKRAVLEPLLARQVVAPPNTTALVDNELWRCSFMAEDDAQRFLQVLQGLGLNTSQGPDSDAVLASEFDGSVQPYCEWLTVAEYQKAVIGWLVGTNPEYVAAYEGWDPQQGSGLRFAPPDELDKLEFVRFEGNVEVFRITETGKEVFIDRTRPSIEALYESATRAIAAHAIEPGAAAVTGGPAEDIHAAIELLDDVIRRRPDAWGALYFRGKGYQALGQWELAYESFKQSFAIEKENDNVPRELALACLELERFDEAVRVAEHAVSCAPKDVGLIGNLALAYLLDQRLDEAQKSINAALRLSPQDSINKYLGTVIEQVANGTRPQPRTMQELTRPQRQRSGGFGNSGSSSTHRARI